MNVELQLACRMEATMRRELGSAARVFVNRRLYQRLGFARLGDYARERLGVSGRTLQAAAWLAARLDALPAVSQAYDRSELSWTQARAICRVASAGKEAHWLDVARRCTVDELERLASRALPLHGIPADPDPTSNEIDGEPLMRWRMACPARVRSLWRRAVELASRVAGGPLPAWQALEAIAAEGFSGRPSGAAVGDRALVEAMRLERRKKRRESSAIEPSSPASVASVGERGAPAALASLSESDSNFGSPRDAPSGRSSPESAPIADESDTRSTIGDTSAIPTRLDAFSLDARLCEALRAIRTGEPRIGRLLRTIVDHRLYRLLGYAKLEPYVRERLGISMRKVWALLKLERATARSADFARAYREGRLSWVRALTLLPVVERANAAAWIERAETVTVRRLCDEVNWVLETRDVQGMDASLAPPPLDSQLMSPAVTVGEQRRESSLGSDRREECRESSPAAEVQIGARSALPAGVVAASEVERRGRSEVCDAEITLVAPATVVALMRDVLDAFAEAGAPRWTALESLLHHVVRYWETLPRHRDPIFARDGWRCAVPACSSRRNLHDHHIRFRSRGGDNARDNRTTVCAAHHLHGLHGGTIRAFGLAPSAIEWELGVRADAPPLLTYVGDRRCATRATALAS